MEEANVFSFSFGGFFNGRKDLQIKDTKIGLVASFSDWLHPENNRQMKVTDKDLEDLERALKDAGIREWFAHYWTPTLDGDHWEMSYKGRTHEGSNSYPEGFAKVITFLENKFEVVGCDPNLSYVERTSDIDPREHIAMYEFYVGDGRETTYADGEELSKHEKSMEEVSCDLRCDLDTLAGIDPVFQEYLKIMKESGIESSIEEMRTLDEGKMDANVIIAMMIFIYRSDRWDGHSEHFLEFVSDGTFKRWLGELRKKIGYGCY